MRSPLIAGNWKMHGSLEQNQAFLSQLQQVYESSAHGTLAIAVPAVYLAQLSSWAKTASISGFAVAAQDVSEHEQGAFTGEVSAAMLSDFSCQYGLVGHSERRQYHNDTDQAVARRAANLQAARITPIICVGETLKEREQEQTLDVIRRQLSAVDALDQSNMVIAYEPVWAIGTGQVASDDQAQAVHQFIREQLGHVGATTQILYGGSVKPSNAAGLFAQADIDGALIGGASLNVNDFLAIAASAMSTIAR